MTNVTETAGVNTYYTELAYDKNGNQLMKRHSSVTDETGEPEYGAEANSEYAEYRYNLFGQLTEMQHGDVTYGYDAFGNQQDSTTDTNPFRYCGEYWDNESGLVYLRARYYDAGIGAFTSCLLYTSDAADE